MNGVIGANSFNIVESTLCNVKMAPSLSSSSNPIPYALAFAISIYCAAKIFHVNSLNAVAGMKKLYFEYPSLHTEINLSSSDNIHLSESVNLPDSIIGKLERNLETFQK